ncbi:DUF1707 SHOCT-like domain-containing protein [Streptomyces zagrosensis]|uniref:Cell wall-active antibiotics response LiaF-like C-terminal domain-containing protein n=1 Tax=Streptomyces zagrosensis TaxID=1042984 RepID=A0A7W9V2R1_9ACTN|nr:DUF1707 domain-containing protein [Streptomyces zagrosensis]MBB5940232.1 hypothetical protein [Streptomyces zagrosensis]
MDEQQPVPLTKSKTATPAPVALPSGAIRASDADRDRVADVLREALAEGRLTAEEHAERISGVYEAKTRGELEPFVRDLPSAGASPSQSGTARPLSAGIPQLPPERSTITDNLIAVFGGASRRGRWRVGGRTNAFALFGGVDIDLTEAVFEQQEIVISVTAIFGGVDIRVPENVTLRSAGTGIFGGFDVADTEAADPAAPVVVVSGLALFGGVEAKTKRGKRVRNLNA